MRDPHSPGSLELCVGLFEVLVPAFCAAIEHYLVATQPLVDFPTVRLLKGILWRSGNGPLSAGSLSPR